MEPQHDRIINGLLKADVGLLTPDAVQARLAQEVTICADPQRATINDLWPCIWFLAAVMECQFTGGVTIDAGLSEPLTSSPIPLSSRCRFVPSNSRHKGVGISIGQARGISIAGDARGNELAYGAELASEIAAHPITACALAGYLGFSALAHAAGIPTFHAQWRVNRMRLPFTVPKYLALPEFAVLGNGQIGQAFLALEFFLAAGGSRPSVHLVDKDSFEDPNARTQVLLMEDAGKWCGQRKVDYLSEICKTWDWPVSSEHVEVDWGWRCDRPEYRLAFLGFDNMDARRIGLEGGFDRLFECGVGTNFCQPRVSWHSLPPDRGLAKDLFKERKQQWSESEFAKSLGETAGACGRVVFEHIEASAPSLGLVAAAFAWGEVLNFLAGDRSPYSGGTYIWSPLLPIDRMAMTEQEQTRRVA